MRLNIVEQSLLLLTLSVPTSAFQTITTAPIGHSSGAFQTPGISAPEFTSRLLRTVLREEKVNTDSFVDEDTRTSSDKFLASKFKDFYALLCKNDNIWKTLKGDSTKGYTLFAPNAEAFEKLGEKKRLQLEDPRNLETAQKMGLYHVIATEAVTNQRLRTEDWTGPKPKDGSPRPITVAGVQTLGGVVPVGREKKGGFLGWGAKEEGDPVVGPHARIVQSFIIEKENVIIHEMDALVSPDLLWRYCDQLRMM